MTGVVAAALASGSWVLMFHGIYGRMYSLFLFTSLPLLIVALIFTWFAWFLKRIGESE